MPRNRDGQRSGLTGAQAATPNTQRGVDDGIDAAIAATQQVRMAQVGGTFGATGRPFAVQVPADASDLELLSLIRFVVELRDKLAAQRGPQIVIPTPVLRRQ